MSVEQVGDVGECLEGVLAQEELEGDHADGLGWSRGRSGSEVDVVLVRLGSAFERLWGHIEGCADVIIVRLRFARELRETQVDELDAKRLRVEEDVVGLDVAMADRVLAHKLMRLQLQKTINNFRGI